MQNKLFVRSIIKDDTTDFVKERVYFLFIALKSMLAF